MFLIATKMSGETVDKINKICRQIRTGYYFILEFFIFLI